VVLGACGRFGKLVGIADRPLFWGYGRSQGRILQGITKIMEPVFWVCAIHTWIQCALTPVGQVHSVPRHVEVETLVQHRRECQTVQNVIVMWGAVHTSYISHVEHVVRHVRSIT
jgi:hypothetical protein